MEQQHGNRARSYWIWALVALAAAAVIASIRGVWSAADWKEAAGILSDSCLISGVMLSGAGGLGFAASRGAYDAMGYAFSRFSLHSLLPVRQTEKRPETFYEYKQAKEQKGRAWSPTVLIAGLGALALSALFLALYALA